MMENTTEKDKHGLENSTVDVIAALHLEDDNTVFVDPAQDISLRWKIDLRLVPLLSITYALNSIDKTTLGYTAVFNLREDLHLVGQEYAWASSVFYLGYLIAEYPANLILQRFPVNIVLSTTVIIWGIILMLHATVHGFGSLTAARTFLGVFEAAINPATMLIFAMYYKRKEQPLRMGIWIGSAGIGYIVAGIASFGMGHINSSLQTWRSMFLIWGAITIAWGVLLLLLLPGSPATSRIWTEEQRIVLLDRIKDNGTGIEDKRFKVKQFREAMLDPKTWMLFLFAVAAMAPNGGLTAFQGLIIKGMGFSDLRVTLIQMPYGGTLFIFTVGSCLLASMFENARFTIMLACLAPFLAGVVGLWRIHSTNPYGRLACLWISFAYVATWTLAMAVTTANTAGHTKKVCTNAVLLIGYCLGNFIGPFFFKTSQAPTYPLGAWMMILCFVIQVVCIAGLWGILWYRNHHQKVEPQTEEERRLARENGFLDVTDGDNKFFKYKY